MTAGGVELATGYISLAVSTRGVGAQINQAFADGAKSADVHGADAGRRFTGGVSKSTQRGGGLADYFFSPALNIAAEKGGKGTGRAFATGITRAITGGVMTSIGTSIGSAVTNAAGNKLKQLAPRMFGGLVPSAAKAGTTAGSAVAGGIVKQTNKMSWSNLSRGKKLAVAAVAAGIFFGTRMGNSAEKQAEKSFKPRLGGSLLSGLRGGAIAAGAAVAGVLGAAVVKGGNRLEAIDDATHKLSGLGHSAKEVTAIMNDSLASVKGTAFGLDEAATVAATAVAAGIKPGKELQKTLKTVADTATIGGASLSEIGSIFNSVAASNKAYNGDLQQLSDRGIPIYQLLGKELGKSTGDVAKLASQGKIHFKEFQNALEKGVGGAALASGDTFRGALKNTGAALSRFGAGLLKGVFPQLKGVFGDVTKALDGAGPVATRVGKKLGAIFSDVVRLVRSALPIFKSVGTILGETFKPFTKSLSGGKGAIKGFTEFIQTHQADIIGFFVSLGHTGIAVGKAIAGGLLVVVGALRGLNVGVNVAITGILDGVHTAVTALAEVAKPIDAAFGTHLSDSLTGVGVKLDAMSKHASDKAHAMDDSLSKVGKGIKDKLLPALDKADAGLTKIGKSEGTKAALRDSFAKTAIAIKNIGRNADGSRLHLKKFSDISDLSAKKQNGLKSRINDARIALNKNIKAVKDAGGGQKELTKTWETGKKRLEAEFKAMGISNKEAKKLADRYAGIKPKVQTKITQPGMPGALSDTQKFHDKLHNLPSPKVKITYSSNAATFAKSFKLGLSLNNGERGSTGTTARGGIAGGMSHGGILPGFTPVWKGDDVSIPLAEGGIQRMRRGEGVYVSEAMKDPYERARLFAVNKAALRGEKLTQFRGLATGGISGTLTRTATTSLDKKGLGIPDFGSLGTRIANALGNKLGALIGAGLDKAAAKAANGPIGGGSYAGALKWARTQVGKPYIFGAAGPRGYDCSGFMAAIQNFIEGKSIYHRRYSTPAFHGNKAGGFTRNKRSAFMVGVNPAPGKSGHMAGTLNGVNVESAGGVGVRVGGRARGWNNGMFSWRGGLALGGLVREDGKVGDLPFDLIDPRGERYNPLLKRIIQQGALKVKKFDDGGYLEPGATLAVNHTNKRETIRTAEQEAALTTPLVGSLTMVSSGDTRRDTDEVMYKLRVIRRGGR